jgi:hypothetical protein
MEIVHRPMVSVLRVFIIGVLWLMASRPVLADLNDGLVANWCFDDCTADDCWGVFSGTDSGASCVSGVVGNAFQFTGTDKVYRISSSWDDQISTAFTIASWVYWYGPSDPDNILFDGRDDSWDEAGFVLYVSASSRKVSLHWFEPGSDIQSLSTLPTNVWTHVAVTFDDAADILRVYMGGRPDNTLATTATHRDSSHQAAIGNNHWSQNAVFNGIIDDLRIYNRALSNDEVQRLSLDTGLVAHWTFDNASDPGHDDSGNGHDGTVIGATPGAGICGGGLNFDGLSDYVQFASPVLNMPPYSVCAWVKQCTPGSDRYVISNGGQTSSSFGFSLLNQYPDPGYWLWKLRGTDGYMAACQPSSGFQPGTEWTFLCGTWDGTLNADSVQLYVDGSLAGVATPGPETSGSALNLRIGAASHSLSSFFAGTMDDVRIYSTVLGADQIQQLYEQCLVNQPPVVICPQPVLIECAASSGEIVELTAHVEDPDGDALSVTWLVDGQLVLEEQVPGGAPPTSADVTLAHAYTVATHAVEIVVSDGQAAPVSCSTPVTVSTDCSLCDQLGGTPDLDTDVYTFQGRAHEGVTVRLVADARGPRNRAMLIVTNIGLAHPHCWVSRMDCSALPNEISLTLPCDGCYLVDVAEQFRGFEGPYCVTLLSNGDAASTFRHWTPHAGHGRGSDSSDESDTHECTATPKSIDTASVSDQSPQAALSAQEYRDVQAVDRDVDADAVDIQVLLDRSTEQTPMLESAKERTSHQ